MSALAERLIRLSGMKKKFVNDEKLAAYIEEKRQDTKPYALPKIIKFKYDIKYSNVDGMDCYIYPGSPQSDKQILYLHGGAYIEDPLFFPLEFSW